VNGLVFLDAKIPRVPVTRRKSIAFRAENHASYLRSKHGLKMLRKRFDMSLECSNKRLITHQSRIGGILPAPPPNEELLAGRNRKFHVFLLFAPISVASMEHDLARKSGTMQTKMGAACASWGHAQVGGM
jgi:hypothetical protein